MATKTNPIVRAIQHSRATPEEKKEAFFTLMEDEALLHINPNVGKKPKLVPIAVTIEDAKQLLANGDEIRGLRTGYRDLDAMTGGLMPSEILVLFADTGIGKSLFSQNVTLNIVKRGEPVLFIGLEMSNTENTLRIMQMNSPENSDISSLPILYPESNDIGFRDIDALVSAAKEHGAVLAVIDHLHMFEVGDANRADGIEDICREFKKVARKHEIPLLLVSHISKRYGKAGPPELDELKGSTAIKQIADIAITLWKDPNADDVDNADLHVIRRKLRKGGRRKRHFTLTPMPNGRLAEMIEMNTFPG